MAIQMFPLKMFFTAVLAAVVLFGGAFTTVHADETDKILRVCQDPNNLPFSNIQGEGIENKLAELMAKKLGWKLEYFSFRSAWDSCATPFGLSCPAQIIAAISSWAFRPALIKSRSLNLITVRPTNWFSPREKGWML